MLLFITSVFLFKNGQSQNLIQNGSFELYTNPIDCGSGGFDNYYYSPAPHVLDNWYGYQSPDYFNSVCQNGPLPNQYGYHIPANCYGYNQAKNGNAYVGLGPYQKNSEVKEYIYQHLNTPLVSGKLYCLSFYMNRSERTEYAIKQIGAYFSSSLPTTVGNMYINVIPQVVNNTFLVDTIQWIQVQGCFTANGGEQYITIGNFNSNTNTDTLNIGTNNPVLGWSPTAYYYIDDITLIDQSTVGVKDVSYLSEAVGVYPNPAIDVLNINIGNLKENTEIKIYNAFGVLVLSESLTTQNSSLKTHHFQNGIYFYYITHDNKVFKQDKLIIIK